jgi:dienelactone hydrolase
MKSIHRFAQFALILVGLGLFASPGRAQPEATTQTTSTFASGDAKIRVSCYAPRTDGKHPALVIVPGLFDVEYSKAVMAPTFKKYAENGYRVYLINYFDRTQTVGKDMLQLREKFKLALKPGNKLDEEMRKKYDDWLDTLRDGLTHIREQPNVDRERLALVGLSLGSYMSLTLAADQNQEIAAVVSFFGGMPRDVAANVKKLPPIKAFHGKLDPVVPVSEAHALKKLGDDKNFLVKLHVFPDAGHMFEGIKGEFRFASLKEFKIADEKMLAFLDTHVRDVSKAKLLTPTSSARLPHCADRSAASDTPPSAREWTSRWRSWGRGRR